MKVKMEGTDFLIPFPPDTEIKILQLQINWLHQKRNTCLKGTTIPNLKVEAVDFWSHFKIYVRFAIYFVEQDTSLKFF